MAWADTANNLRQQIGQKTSNIANIGQSERESRRARNVALLNNLTQIGMGIGEMGFKAGEAEKGREFEREQMPRQFGYDTAKIKYEYELRRQEIETERLSAINQGDHERAADLEKDKAKLDHEYKLKMQEAEYSRGTQWGVADRYGAGQTQATEPMDRLEKAFGSWSRTPGRFETLWKLNEKTGEYDLNSAAMDNTAKEDFRGFVAPELQQYVDTFWGKTQLGTPEGAVVPEEISAGAAPESKEEERKALVSTIRDLKEQLKQLPQTKDVQRALSSIPGDWTLGKSTPRSLLRLIEDLESQLSKSSMEQDMGIPQEGGEPRRFLNLGGTLKEAGTGALQGIKNTLRNILGK